MKPITRDQIVDIETYEERREHIRARAMVVKEARRIHVGDHLTFLFENQTTIAYQIQEMMRAERIVKQASIDHEIETYNELLGGDGELGCTLFIEIETAQERDVLLRCWLGLPYHLYALMADKSKVRPSFDKRQVGDERLSSVQYLKFDTGGQLPLALGSDMAALTLEHRLNQSQLTALAEDL